MLPEQVTEEMVDDVENAMKNRGIDFMVGRGMCQIIISEIYTICRQHLEEGEKEESRMTLLMESLTAWRMSLNLALPTLREAAYDIIHRHGDDSPQDVVYNRALTHVELLRRDLEYWLTQKEKKDAN